MSSYLSSIFTSTTSRVNSIRKNLLSDEADGDSEDNTHISRILRSYYIEKGRPFPPWLPPDPKAPQPAPVQYIANPGRGSQAHPPPAGSGLSDLWDPPQSQAPAQESLSLRRAGPGRGAQAPSRAPLHGRGESYSSSQSTPYPLGSERPVPSQRGGSYQSTIAQQENQRQSNNNSPLQSPGLGTSADRLKAKLWGASRTSSSSNVTPVSTTSTEEILIGVPATGQVTLCKEVLMILGKLLTTQPIAGDKIQAMVEPDLGAEHIQIVAGVMIVAPCGSKGHTQAHHPLGRLEAIATVVGVTTGGRGMPEGMTKASIAADMAEGERPRTEVPVILMAQGVRDNAENNIISVSFGGQEVV
ncbi:MAG: hypothetical protein M1829_004324 [Trizodia sp. TS-e1964]|nr:MAG: hypothetical protein M1829_004324 [Trizodia sp. TS-e1964]